MNAVGLQGPGSSHWLAECSRRCSTPGRRWSRASGAARSTTTAAPPRCSPSAPPRSSRSRSTCRARTSRGGGDLRPRRRAVGRGDRRDRRLRPPRWAKLSANTDRIIEVAGAVAAGAEAVTVLNTLLGLAYDPDTLAPTLGAGGGGLSGRAIHPVAVRAVHDVHAGAAGRADHRRRRRGVGWDAVEMLLAGACAVQVGTASFADPAAPRTCSASWSNGPRAGHRPLAETQRATLNTWQHLHS